MSASAASSISVTMSVEVDLVVDARAGPGEAIDEQRACVLRELRRERQECGQVRTSATALLSHGLTVGGSNLRA